MPQRLLSTAAEQLSPFYQTMAVPEEHWWTKIAHRQLCLHVLH